MIRPAIPAFDKHTLAHIRGALLSPFLLTRGCSGHHHYEAKEEENHAKAHAIADGLWLWGRLARMHRDVPDAVRVVHDVLSAVKARDPDCVVLVPPAPQGCVPAPRLAYTVDAPQVDLTPVCVGSTFWNEKNRAGGGW